MPATPLIQPQRAQQLSVGVARTLRGKDAVYELSFKSYYRPMQNLVEYREGASFLGTVDSDWENKVTSGKK